MFKIKKKDTLPPLTINLKTLGNLGQKIDYDLLGVSGITFSMYDHLSNVKTYNKSAQTICASGGTIQYSWQEEDTDTEGIFYGEFKLKYNTGKIMSIPTQGGIKIEILKNINPF